MNRIHMEREIDRLRRQLLEMSAEVEQGLALAFRSLVDGDREAAGACVENDRKIDQHEVDIEEECLKILALYQPVASELRRVVAILKINNDLERVGDLARNIAEYVTEMAACVKVEIPGEFRPMFTGAREMMRLTLDAFIKLDPDLAYEVCRADDLVDDFNVRIIRYVQQQVVEHPDQVKPLLFLISISRSIERVADYATNIAEDSYYMATGHIIRHRLRDEASAKEQEDTTS